MRSHFIICIPLILLGSILFLITMYANTTTLDKLLLAEMGSLAFGSGSIVLLHSMKN
jgi:hypothetical protein